MNPTGDGKKSTNRTQDVTPANQLSAGMMIIHENSEESESTADSGKALPCKGDSGGPGYSLFANLFRADVIAFLESSIETGTVIPGLEVLKSQAI